MALQDVQTIFATAKAQGRSLTSQESTCVLQNALVLGFAYGGMQNGMEFLGGGFRGFFGSDESRARAYDHEFNNQNGSGGGGGRSTDIPSWKGSGPVSGVLAVNANSKSVRAIQEYYPSEGAVEFVFDTRTNTFAVGKPNDGSIMGSPHQRLAASIGADGRTIVGGMFKRGPNGEILTNEFSGHYWQNWTPEIRQQFERVMREYGLPVMHSEGM